MTVTIDYRILAEELENDVNYGAASDQSTATEADACVAETRAAFEKRLRETIGPELIRLHEKILEVCHRHLRAADRYKEAEALCDQMAAALREARSIQAGWEDSWEARPPTAAWRERCERYDEMVDGLLAAYKEARRPKA
jgi:hypothetical protein